jgi:hypothetical protein
MTRPGSVEVQRRELARRLRPLYAAMSKAEFERMVARIAEVELYGSSVEPIDGDDRAIQRTSTTALGARRRVVG